MMKVMSTAKTTTKYSPKKAEKQWKNVSGTWNKYNQFQN